MVAQKKRVVLFTSCHGGLIPYVNMYVWAWFREEGDYQILIVVNVDNPLPLYIISLCPQTMIKRCLPANMLMPPLALQHPPHLHPISISITQLLHTLVPCLPLPPSMSSNIFRSLHCLENIHIFTLLPLEPFPLHPLHSCRVKLVQ